MVASTPGVTVGEEIEREVVRLTEDDSTGGMLDGVGVGSGDAGRGTDEEDTSGDAGGDGKDENSEVVSKVNDGVSSMLEDSTEVGTKGDGSAGEDEVVTAVTIRDGVNVAVVVVVVVVGCATTTEDSIVNVPSGTAEDCTLGDSGGKTGTEVRSTLDSRTTMDDAKLGVASSGGDGEGRTTNEVGSSSDVVPIMTGVEVAVKEVASKEVVWVKESDGDRVRVGSSDSDTTGEDVGSDVKIRIGIEVDGSSSKLDGISVKVGMEVGTTLDGGTSEGEGVGVSVISTEKIIEEKVGVSSGDERGAVKRGEDGITTMLPLAGGTKGVDMTADCTDDDVNTGVTTGLLAGTSGVKTVVNTKKMSLLSADGCESTCIACLR